MYRWHKRTFLNLAGLLCALAEDPDDHETLLTLQRRLINCIRRTDRRIAKLKQQRADLQRQKKSRLSKDAANQVKRLIQVIDEKLEFERALLFIFRCFGDGIAFIYIDAYALKHVFYNTHDYTVKPAAGALAGKEGLQREWAILERLVTVGPKTGGPVPAVLCDLTNTVRHGDVCVLIGPDPYPIEVKSSGNTSARAERQISSLKQLHGFFLNDSAENFRGLSQVKRVEVPVPQPARYGETMTECILQSRTRGFASACPEKGLTYACLRDPAATDQLFSALGPRQIITILNEAKTEHTWMPYYPFTLSITDPDALYDFISGNVTLIVLLDADVFVQCFAEKGLAAEFVEHDVYIVRTYAVGSSPDTDGFSMISRQAFGRLPHEFGSITELADLQVADVTTLKDEFSRLQERIARGELPPDSQTMALPIFRPLAWPTPDQ